MTRVRNPADVAELFEGWVKELVLPDGTTNNTGRRIRGVQFWSGGQDKDSWCMEAATLCYEIAYAGQCPFPAEQSVDEFLQLARKNGWVTMTPVRGDLCISATPAGVGHHVGIIKTLTPLTTSAGNTSADGTSSNGDGWYGHPVSPAGKIFVHVPE